MHYEAATTKLDLARLLHGGDPQAAVGRACSAHGRLQQLGARHATARAAAILRSLGALHRPVRDVAAPVLRAEGLWQTCDGRSSLNVEPASSTVSSRWWP